MGISHKDMFDGVFSVKDIIAAVEHSFVSVEQMLNDKEMFNILSEIGEDEGLDVEEAVSKVLRHIFNNCCIFAACINVYNAAKLDEGDEDERVQFLVGLTIALMELEDSLDDAPDVVKIAAISGIRDGDVEKIDGETIPDDLLDELSEKCGVSKDVIRQSYVYGYRTDGGKPVSPMTAREMIDDIKGGAFSKKRDGDDGNVKDSGDVDRKSVEDLFAKAKLRKGGK